MKYQTKKFNYLLGLSGLSDGLMNNHFKLYQGYVTNTNKLTEEIAKLHQENKINTPEYAEIKRRFGWEFNGMRLHEYFFRAIIKDFKELKKDSKLSQKIIENFGSFENWQEDFKATAAMRGIGWVILYYDQQEDKLFNVWVNEHDFGHLAGATLLLNIDMFEHAFMLDGLSRDDYIDIFLKVINWQEINKRFISVKQ